MVDVDSWNKRGLAVTYCDMYFRFACRVARLLDGAACPGGQDLERSAQ
jgi:hypothetical protein